MTGRKCHPRGVRRPRSNWHWLMKPLLLFSPLAFRFLTLRLFDPFSPTPRDPSPLRIPTRDRHTSDTRFFPATPAPADPAPLPTQSQSHSHLRSPHSNTRRPTTTDRRLPTARNPNRCHRPPLPPSTDCLSPNTRCAPGRKTPTDPSPGLPRSLLSHKRCPFTRQIRGCGPENRHQRRHEERWNQHRKANPPMRCTAEDSNRQTHSQPQRPELNDGGPGHGDVLARRGALHSERLQRQPAPQRLLEQFALRKDLLLLLE
jgi:hypothetical protein